MKITLSTGRVIEAKEGETILESLKHSGIFLTSSCGGKGVCGKCKIIIQAGDVDSKSHLKLSSEEIREGYALACMTTPSGDITVDIPNHSILTVEGQIVTGRSEDLLGLLHSTGEDVDPLSERIVLKLPQPSLDDNISDLERLKRELFANGLGCLRVPSRFMSNLARTVRQENWEITLSAINSEDCYEITNIFPGNKKVPQYGIAIDIGTTTIVVYLIDLTDGQLVDAASIYNSQIRFGDDVITRIVNATEHNEMENLHKAVISDINDLLSVLVSSHKVDTETIDTIVVAGNTTMTHFFLDLDPSAIREEPYIPTANVFPLSHAGELGIEVNRKVPVYSFPCVASYVGGDIVSGVLATRMHKSENLSI
ncbi:MAG: 2Fe-2S iron-sulfur cluster binding domain-containing protein, partial [Nitrospira sp.]|nr:2Fe-2S iron-sulfur cluster binding domain-containing protein [Nitrospira sp.]